MKKLLLLTLAALALSSPLAAYTVPRFIPDGRTSTGAVFYQPWIDFVDFMDAPCSTALRPADWSSPVAGYYYINFATGTDSGRTYGTPSAPRQTIPVPLAGPAYVELAAGVAYNQRHAGIGTDSSFLELNGADANNYVCIAGAAGSTVTNSFHFRNSEYFIVDNITHIGNANGDNGVVWVGPVFYSVFRNGDISGDETGGGWDMGAGPSGGYVQYAAILDTDVHDIGEWDGIDDSNDAHCGKISFGTFFVWVLNGEHHHCGGDSIQIESRDSTNPIGNNQNANGYPEGARWLFFGGLELHHNRQTGLWTKFGMDVIYASNLCYQMLPAGESSGEVCLGGQYQPFRLWVVGNRVVSVRHGLRIASTDCVYVPSPNECTQGFKESPVYIVGNLFDHQYTADGDGPAISTWGGTQIIAAWNTIYDWSEGYTEPSSHNFGNRYILNNIFDTIDNEHISIDGDWAASHGAIQGNVHKLPYLQALEGTPTAISTPFSNANIRIVTDVMMTDPANGLFGLQDNSPAINFEPVALSGLVTEYEDLYGVTLSIDYLGNPRFNGITDAGFLEKTNPVPATQKKRLRFRVP